MGSIAGQTVGAFILRMPGMAFNPYLFHLMPVAGIEQRAP